MVRGLSFRQVDARSHHACGKTPTAAGYCWSDNYDGRLGDGTNVSRTRPVAVVESS
jgi:hypothetical protein